MSPRVQRLHDALQSRLGARAASLGERLGELTLEVRATDYLDVARELRDAPELRFAQLLDLCGIDYATYAERGRGGPRFAATAHLLSVEHNWRLRYRAFAPDDEFPVLASLTEVWPSANWFEREAFDLYGIVFEGHADLRRILTDYGFIGHPFRKDFPLSGHVEMRYDPDQGRVVYQPVTIELREITPRVVREPHYAESGGGTAGSPPKS
jgi:NADH-quinone oxidoreductase subunit C